MAGAIVMIVVLVIVLPVVTLMSGAVGAGLLGWLVNRETDASHEGSELLAISRANPYEPAPADDA